MMATMTADQRLFESYLAPALQPAYGTAYYLTRSPEAAEGLLQEAAVRAYQAFPTFEPGACFKAWFLKFVTASFLKDRGRSAAGVGLREESFILEEVFHEDGSGGALPIQQLDPEQISDALASLPESYRVVCTLYFMDDLNYQQIADIVECPVDTVRARIHCGRRTLQRALYRVAVPFNPEPAYAA
jgi:RNA polymerase sigma-70 factor (ECF subfamily)